MKVNSISRKFIKPDSSPGKQVKWLIDNVLFLFIPFEIKLPSTNWVGYIALLVRDTQADLD